MSRGCPFVLTALLWTVALLSHAEDDGCRFRWAFSLSTNTIVSGQPLSVLLHLDLEDAPVPACIFVKGKIDDLGIVRNSADIAMPARPQEAWYPPTNDFLVKHPMLKGDQATFHIPLNRYCSTLLRPGDYHLSLQPFHLTFEVDMPRVQRVQSWHSLTISNNETLRFSVGAGDPEALADHFRELCSSVLTFRPGSSLEYPRDRDVDLCNKRQDQFARYYEFLYAFGPVSSDFHLSYLREVFKTQQRLLEEGMDLSDKPELSRLALYEESDRVTPYFFENDLLVIARSLKYSPSPKSVAGLVDFLTSSPPALAYSSCLRSELIHSAHVAIQELGLEDEYGSFMRETASSNTLCSKWVYLDMVNFPDCFNPMGPVVDRAKRDQAPQRQGGE